MFVPVRAMFVHARALSVPDKRQQLNQNEAVAEI